MLARHDQTLAFASCAAIAITTLLGGAPALAKGSEPALRTIPTALMPLIRVYTGGKGHFLIAAERPSKRKAKLLSARQRHVYFGSAKQLYRLRPYSTTGPAIRLADPRRRQSKLTLDPQTGPVFHCDQSRKKLRVLDKEATKRFLARAKLRDVYWRHEPHLLARTATGHYFYVDRRRIPFRAGRRAPVRLENLRGFRMWRGRRGRMKRVKLKDVVIDAAGQVFLGKRGSLHVKTRLGRFDKIYIQDVRWRNKRKKTVTKLVRVPIKGVRATWILIHRDLGPYTGKKLGLPCDVW